MNSSPSIHPSANDLGAFLQGSLERNVNLWIEEHLGACTHCARALDSLSSGEDGLDSKIKSIHDRSNNHEFFELDSDTTSYGRPFRRKIDELVRTSLPSVSIAKQRYHLGDEIARGGMGIVFRGQDSVLNRELAFKVLDDCGNTEAVQRFVTEARICGSLQHPGIVPVHDMGRLGDRRPFFAMKRIQGLSLSQMLHDRKTAIDERPRFLGIFTQVCQTIAYAHSQRVIHRDLKPHNIMVGAFGEVQVLDWGLAKRLQLDVPSSDALGELGNGRNSNPSTSTVQQSPHEEEVECQTGFGKVMGTPAYMAPEQALGHVREVDERSDVFALGAILCEILTGRPPYWNDLAAATRSIEDAETGNLSGAYRRLAACSDRALAEFCKRCLAPNRTDRPNDASAIAEFLVKHHEAVSERLRKVELSEASAKAQLEERRKRQRTVYIAAAIVTCLLVTLAAGYFVHRLRTKQQNAVILRESMALKVEQDNHERAILLASRHQGRDWRQLLAFANDAPDDSPRVAVEQLQREYGTRFPPNDSEFLRRILEAHRWSTTQARGNVRDQCYLESMDGYRSTFQILAAWDPIGGVPVFQAVDAIKQRPAYIVDSTINAIDDWIRLITRLNENKSLPHTSVAETNWLARIADKLEDKLDAQTLPRRIRHAVVEKQIAELTRLAEHAEVAKQRPAVLCLLADALDLFGKPERAARLLDDAKKMYPDSFWLRGEVLPLNRSTSATASATASGTASAGGSSAGTENDGVSTRALWTPATNVECLSLLFEARSDARAKRFDQALLKYQWLGGNLTPDLENILWQFWYELAQTHESANAQLESHRRSLGYDAINGEDAEMAFRNFATINQVTNREEATSSLFEIVDQKDRDLATKVFPFARQSLMKSGKSELVDAYAGKGSFGSMVGVDSANEPDNRRRFENILRLIALLARAGERVEAEEVARDARRIWKDSNDDIDRAIRGEIISLN